MNALTWSHLGEIFSNDKYHMYYRGERIKKAYYRGELIWGEIFLRILLDRLPDKLHYSPNEEIDYAGVRILGVWSPYRKADITPECEFSPKEGMIINPSNALLGIVLAELPYKTTYSAGERIDYGGVRVLAVYADWNTVDVTPECAFSPADGTLVNAIFLVGLLVIKLPTKTSYVAGESLDYAGVSVVAVYSNGHTVDVTSECEFVPENGSVV